MIIPAIPLSVVSLCQSVSYTEYPHRFIAFLITILTRNRYYVDIEPVQRPDPCSSSPCGANARCNNGICTCIPEYFGDPYIGCRPECVLSTDCSADRACIRNKCMDPCPGTCGQNSLCSVINHTPMCSCPPGTAGNAFISCDVMRGMMMRRTRNEITKPT
jgi:hypothetical protein